MVAMSLKALAPSWSLLLCYLAVAQAEDTVEIAPGVHMPFLNSGKGNRSLWVEVGGRGLDTALVYGDADQKATGDVIAKSGVARSDLFVTTKIPCCPASESHFPEACKVSNTTANLEHDLEMLGIPQVDVMLMHWPCPSMENTVATWRAMEEFYKQGKARALGVSNFNASTLEKFVVQTKVKPVVNQVGFSIGGHAGSESPFGRDDVTLAKCKELGITLTAYAPLGGATGIDVLHEQWVNAVAKAHNRSAAQVALRWLVQQGIPLVTKTTSKEHAEDDLSVLNGFTLTDVEMQILSAVKLSEPTSMTSQKSLLLI